MKTKFAFDGALAALNNPTTLKAVLGAGVAGAATGGYLASRKKGPRKGVKEEDPKDRRARVLANALGVGATAAGGTAAVTAGLSAIDKAIPSASALPAAPPSALDGLRDAGAALLSGAGSVALGASLPVGAGVLAHKGMKSSDFRNANMTHLVDRLNALSTPYDADLDKDVIKLKRAPAGIPETYPSNFGLPERSKWDAATLNLKASTDTSFLRRLATAFEDSGTDPAEVRRLMRGAGLHVNSLGPITEALERMSRNSSARLANSANLPSLSRLSAQAKRGLADGALHASRGLGSRLNLSTPRFLLGTLAAPLATYALQKKIEEKL